MSRSADQGISTTMLGLTGQEEARDAWSWVTIGDGRLPGIKNLLEWKSLVTRTISIEELTGAKYGQRAEPFMTHLVHKGAALMADGDLKYPWQQFLLEAFMEFDPERFPVKIDEARRVISARLCDLRPDDEDERTALSDAMRSLQILEPKGQIA